MSRLATRQLFAAVPDRVLFQALDFEVEPGQSWGVLGPNGAGKSTLLHTLAGLRNIQHGEVLLDGKALGTWSHRDRAQRIGLLLQDTFDAFPASVLETALIGRHPHLGRWGWESAEDYELAERALAAMALQGFDDRRTDTLSGGGPGPGHLPAGRTHQSPGSASPGQPAEKSHGLGTRTKQMRGHGPARCEPGGAFL